MSASFVPNADVDDAPYRHIVHIAIGHRIMEFVHAAEYDRALTEIRRLKQRISELEGESHGT
jgi:hypothetical protein